MKALLCALSILVSGLVASPSFATYEFLTPDPITEPGVEEFHQMDANHFRGGRPDLTALKVLKSLGVRTIIDLEDNHFVLPEKKWVEGLGMTFIHIPMAWDAPPVESRVNAVLKDLSDQNLFPAYLHCKHGQDRTGFIWGLYRVEAEGWKAADAYAEMLKLNFHPEYQHLDQYFKSRAGVP